MRIGIGPSLCGNLAVLAGEEFFKGLAGEAGHFFCSRQQAFDTQVAIQSLPMQGVIENFHLLSLFLGRQKEGGNMIQRHQYGDSGVQLDPELGR